jgi:hypothetical protein
VRSSLWLGGVLAEQFEVSADGLAGTKGGDGAAGYLIRCDE